MKNIRNPNIIYVYADDLGRGMLSCYGQKIFNTPNIDRLAAQGMRFMHSYGCSYCAPARASLLTGYHDCHAGKWTTTSGGAYNKLTVNRMSLAELSEIINNSCFMNDPDEVFLPQILKQAGYMTGQIGKLEWGFSETRERIMQHGWDYHYGYYDHVLCHGFYPPHLYENGDIVKIPGNTHDNCGKNANYETDENYRKRHDMTGKAIYSQDIFNKKIIEFINNNKERPFFLYHPSQLPHGPVSVPEIHQGVRNISGLTEFEKEYASMVLRLDDTIGLISDELFRLGLSENTVFIFSSDNGHEVYYLQEGRTENRKSVPEGELFDNITTKFYTDNAGDIFNGNDGMAGIKYTSWEGGVRIPYIVSWPGKIKPGSVSNHIIANYDLMPTLAEIAGIDMPPGKDGISFLHILSGNADIHEQHDFIVYSSSLGPALVSRDGWKLRNIYKDGVFQLYNINDDYAEEKDLAVQYPQKVEELASLLLKACDGDYLHGTPEFHQVYIL